MLTFILFQGQTSRKKNDVILQRNLNLKGWHISSKCRYCMFVGSASEADTVPHSPSWYISLLLSNYFYTWEGVFIVLANSFIRKQSCREKLLVRKIQPQALFIISAKETGIQEILLYESFKSKEIVAMHQNINNYRQRYFTCKRFVLYVHHNTIFLPLTAMSTTEMQRRAVSSSLHMQCGPRIVAEALADWAQI